MLNAPKGTVAALAIQCQSPDGKIGDFIFLAGENRTPSTGLTLSPVFTSLVYLFDWLDTHGWKAMPYNSMHPTGRYIKEDEGPIKMGNNEDKKGSYITIVAEAQHARRIISHLISRQLRKPIEFFYLEGEYYIQLPSIINLDHLRHKLKGVEFYLT